ncbi:hypothetical protein [Nocardiopsis sp. ATB16-24]|uniref:hypothetical protein n=1 Tax=Nocardiopsis sp. ATB16-24 TaxID=3019555 RepID=UPI002555771C|nr:hypothetical protein [Nocardiopsis sp. ATB16-24]
MTDNGGERRDSGAEDSWFKPSENRYRKQSEYQDPLEEQESAETVFPDSGGYTGLSSSRPPLAEPYPEALGGPPTSGGISYPGAGEAAYRPLTRVPGDPEEPGLPGVAGSARVPLPESDHPEGPRTEQIAAVGSWGKDGGLPTPGQTEDDGLRGPDVQGPDAQEDRPWDPGPAREETGVLGADAWSGPVGEEPDTPSWDSSPSAAGPVGVPDAGVVGGGSWEPGPVDGRGSDGGSSFAGRPWDAGSAVGRDSGEGRSDEHGEFGEAGRSWADVPGGEYGSEPTDGGGWSAASGREEVDELGPASWDEEPDTPSWASSPSVSDSSGAADDGSWDVDPREGGRDTSSGGDPGTFSGGGWSAASGREEVDELGPASWGEDRPTASWDSSPSAAGSVGVPDAGVPDAGVVGGGSWEPGPVDGRGSDGDASFAERSWDAGSAVGRDSGAGDPGEGRSDERDGFGEAGRSWAGVPGGEYASEPTDGGGWSAASGREEVDELGPASWDEDRPTTSWNTPSSAVPGTGERTDTVGTYPTGGNGEAQTSSGWRVDVPQEDDPLGDHGRSWDEEPNVGSGEIDGRTTDGGAPEPWAPRWEDGDGRADTGTGGPWTGEAQGGTGNTWAFDRNDPRLPDVVREAEERRRGAATGTPTEAEWGGPDTGELSAAVPASDDPLGAIAAMQTRARSRGENADDAARVADDGGDPETDAPGHDHDREYDERAAVDTEGGTEEREYDDGFTPADYGMPETPVRRRRKDPIADDFPGFDDRPLGGEAGDPYPGYDSIDFLADTERGALVTLWLGVASLIPGLGLVFALLTLLVTGPKAKRAIRGSNGQLDGLGLITAGTVFAVIGILVTVISVALWLIL